MYTDTEAREVYIQLQTVLLRSELSWIIPQIQEEIAKGKITPKSIKDIVQSQALSLFETFEQEVGKRTSKEQVFTSQAYTDIEQLTILLNALLEITEINVIRKQILTNLQEVDRAIISVQFASEETNDTIPLIDEYGQQRMDSNYDNLIRIMNQLKSDSNGLSSNTRG